MSIIFDLPDIKCKYALNQRGIAKYGSLDDLLLKPFEMCKVGKKEGNYDLPHIRSGKYRNSRIVFENYEELNSLIFNKLLDIVPESSIEDLRFDINNKYQVLKYEENDFFKRHQDNIINGRHFGTLLIFPPAIGELEHQGGKLLLDETNIEFESSNNTSWKAIILLCDIPHEIEKIISGTRIVFKTQLFYKVNHSLGYNIFPDVMDVGIQNDIDW